jgi:hypothetical protein
MTTDSIKLGETYDLSAAAQDADGNAIVLDGTWQVACRACARKVGGATVADIPMTIAAGVATGQIDTGDSPWTVGMFYFDIRFTDADGNDYWSEPWQLEIQPRNTPASTEI